MNRPLTTALGWRLPDWLLDVGPVAVIVIEGGLAIRLKETHTSVPAAVLALGLAASAVALLLRHRAPLVVLGVVLVIALGLDYGPIVALPTMLAVFTVAEYTERSKVIGAAAIAALVVVLSPAVHDHPLLNVSQTLGRFVAIGLAVALGLYLRARADYVTGLKDRAERLERERELLAGRAVADERVRIARELHDVVAHNVSLMVVQAQALAATGTPDEEQRAALDRIAGIGRQALSEMHRMLGVLRVPDAGAPELEPQPGVRDLTALVRRTREAGLVAELVIEGTPRELPPAVDLSAYRIAQEALTNVIRHARAAHTTVTLRYRPEALELTVRDDGVGATNGANGGGGHGLVGMRERVALFAGSFEAGPVPGGTGYRIHATLPLR